MIFLTATAYTRIKEIHFQEKMMRKGVLMLLAVFTSMAMLTACGNDIGENGISGGYRMIVEVNGEEFTATLCENRAAAELVRMMENQPVEIEMRDYGGFEKVGSLGRSLPADNRQITTQAGDIVLYQGNQIVMFYGSNTWSYTQLAHIDDLTGWYEAISGRNNVTVIFSVKDNRTI